MIYKVTHADGQQFFKAKAHMAHRRAQDLAGFDPSDDPQKPWSRLPRDYTLEEMGQESSFYGTPYKRNPRGNQFLKKHGLDSRKGRG